jgi:CubicO group peptidase (beta-lactamase class C family)
MRVLLALLAACSAAPRPHPKPLDGLWGGDIGVTESLSGELVLEQRDDGWHAMMRGHDTVLELDGDIMSGTLGTSRLRVRRLAPDRLAAWWIHPDDAVEGPYAIPVALAWGSDGRFRARVPWTGSTLRAFVSIANGRAFVRDPDRNLGKPIGMLRVTGDELRDTHDHVVATRRGNSLELHVAGFTLSLTRRRREDATAFYARPPGPVQLDPPRERDDGWRIATLEAAGFDPKAIEAIVADLARDVPDGPSTRAIHSLVIARHGALVVEEYFAGHHGELHDTRSAAKSISTTIAGIEIDRGALALDTPLYDTVGLEPDDPRKRAIQLHHVLAMSTGLACDDEDEHSPGNEATMTAQTAQRDWYRYILDVPVAHPPGTGVYCSGAINLTGAMVAARTGAYLPDLVAELFAQLDIAHYTLPLMPDDRGYFGGGIAMTARDFAKLPQVFLDGGTWRGRRIVSEAWTRDATAAHASLAKPDDYGYGWWRTSYRLADGSTADAFFASGNGGQIAMAIPKLDVVIAIQAGNYNARSVWQHELDDLVPAILRAIR